MSVLTNPIYKHAPEEFFPSSPALEVARAIRRDDVAALDKVFAQHPGLDPNQEGKEGMTFLFWAFAHHHVKSMRALVAHKADVNRPLRLPNEQGGVDVTHLVNIAAEGPKDELLVALLDLGANPDVKDENKEPPILNAMYAHQYQRMKLLLDRRANIDGADSSGATAAVIMSRLNYFEMVYYLLERGADWRKVDGTIAFNTQEMDIGNAETTRWQIKVKHWLIAKGVKFPVPSSGAASYDAVRAKWEQTPEGQAWRTKLDALGAQPDIVGKAWMKEEDKAFDAMRAWMEREGIPFPPL